MIGLATRGKFGSCCGAGGGGGTGGGGGGGGGVMPPMSIRVDGDKKMCKNIEVKLVRMEEEDVRVGVVVDSVDEE